LPDAALAHILRSAAYIANDGDILILGSQSILGTFAEDQLPDEAVGSIEADVAFFDDPGEEKSDAVDGAIGEGSPFHDTHGIYGQGVSVSTAILPRGWQDRLVPYQREDAFPGEGKCLDAHDLVISKLVAGRQKDRAFAQALVDARLISCELLFERVGMLEAVGAIKGRVREEITRIQRKSKSDSTGTT
jgi:hypothetical protein